LRSSRLRRNLHRSLPIPERHYREDYRADCLRRWREDTITWNNQPAFGDVISTFIIQDHEGRWNSIDITDYVREEFLKDKVVSICLKTAEEREDIAPETNYLKSKESENYPRLELELEKPPILTVKSSPIAGVPIILDGEGIGITPVSQTVTVGEHTLEVPGEVEVCS